MQPPKFQITDRHWTGKIQQTSFDGIHEETQISTRLHIFWISNHKVHPCNEWPAEVNIEKNNIYEPTTN